MLFESATCLAGAYTSQQSGAKSTTYYGPTPCTPSSSYVNEETLVVGFCATNAAGTLSEDVKCNQTHIIVTGYLGG